MAKRPRPLGRRALFYALLASASGACEPAGADRIVYSSFRPVNWDIYLFSEPGRPPTALTTHPSLDYDPVFSPDGRWVVFTSERLGTPDLFALDLNALDSEPRLLIDSSAIEDQAAFSPDAGRIAFVSTVSGNADIFVMSFLPNETQSMEAATNVTDHPGGDFRPAFSPSGSQLAFSTDRDTEPVGHPVFPFARQREGEVYLLELFDESTRRLTELAGWDGSPAWSHDGSRILFYSSGGAPRGPSRRAPTQEGGFGIWGIEIDGSERIRISPEGVEGLSPRLTANGRIVFNTRDGDGYDADWDVVSIAPDGTDLRSETDGELDCWIPDTHADRGMVCHGPGTFEIPDSPVPGFEEAPLLFPGYPTRSAVGDREVRLYSMNHGFSVPPHPTQDQILVGGQGGEAELFVSRIDGGDARRIAGTERGAIMGMRWSKDGAWVTYSVGPFLGGAGARADVWRVRPDGTEGANLTRDSTVNDAMSDYLSDGQSLVFRSGRGEAFDLYLISRDGGPARQILDDVHKDNFPAASPTGRSIAFVSDRDGRPDPNGNKDFDIYLSTLDGTRMGELLRITTSRGQDSHVQFSPDGEWLIYTSERGGINDEEPLLQELMFNPQMYGEIFAYRISDGNSVRLTHNKWEDGGPFWVGPVSPVR